MSRTYYQIYKEQTFVLARTLIVKHEEVASSMNTELYYRGYVVDSDPYNWRYYLNLSGEYHKADKDELYEKYGTQYMMVKIPSLLGSVEVPLTKELLHGNNADKTMMNEYQIGSKFYEELVSRYPDYETLIIGIINPIDIDVALKADNGEILFIAGRYKRIVGERKYFDTTWFSINEVLIEEQEDNLILELQRYINQFLRHWNNVEYINGNDLYVVTMLGILYANIPTTLFNIRLGNCKTSRAHTFHIRQYLESFGQIGRYVDFIPIETALWLYMNVHYLEANAGKQKTFELIMDKMLTPNQIPMSTYTARHELSTMDENNPLPNTMLYKEVLNFSILGASDDDRTVLDILEDEKDMARDNDKDLDEKREKIQSTMDWGGDDRLNTKVLESEMIDIGEPYPFTLSQMLFNMWGYTVAKGYYTGTAYATNPLTGDRLSFNSKSAYILAMYCLNKAVAGKELTRIPSIKLYGIPRTDQPDDYPTDKQFLKKPDIDKMMSWCVTGVTRRLKVLEVRGTHIPTFLANDSEKFFDNVEEIYLERVRRYHTYCDVENLEERGDLELVAKRLYWQGFEEKLIEMDYDQWFRTIGFDITRFTDNDLLEIGLELVASATGVSEQDDVRKKWLQKSLLSILKHFVSYTVHVIEKYTDGVVAYLEGQTLRYSNFKWTYINPLQAQYSVALDYKMAFYLQQSIHVDISNAFENTKISVNTKSKVPLDLSSFDYKQKRHTINVGTYSLGTKLFNIEFNTEKKEPVYITIIDNVVNTILLVPLAGAIDDEDFIHSMDADISYVKPYDVSARLRDLNQQAFVRDTKRNSVTVNGSFAELFDDNRQLENSRLDNEGIVTRGMFGGTSDSSITDIGFIDSSSVVSGSITAEDSYAPSTQTRDVDNGTTAISQISAEVDDSSVKLEYSDTTAVTINPLLIGIMDPEIPPIDNAVDSNHVNVIDISGKSQDVNIVTVGTSDGFIDLYNIEVMILDEAYDDIIVTPIVSTDVLDIGHIAAKATDEVTTSPLLDNQTVIAGLIDITVNDETSVVTIDVDNAVIDTINIQGTVSDTADATTIESDTIDVTNIVMNIVDDAVKIPTMVDVTTIEIEGIAASVVDVNPLVNYVDTSYTDIHGIQLLATDDNVNYVTNQDSSSVVIDNIQLSLNDVSNDRQGIDENYMTVNRVHGSLSDRDIGYRAYDNSVTSIPMSLIKVDIQEPEIVTDFGDPDDYAIQMTSIHASTDDNPNLPTNVDNHAVQLGALTLNMTGSTDAVDPINVDDNQIVRPTSIRGNLVDYRFVQAPSDLSSISINQIKGGLKDFTIKLDNHVNHGAVQINSSNITINVTDSDIMLDGADSATIGISQIKMKLNEESDDSQ